MKFRYVLFDPTKNITALVTSPAEKTEYAGIARTLMEKEPACEQVGFVRDAPDGFELCMAGGEFCGNASMSAAALWCRRRGLDSTRVSGTVSGTDRAVSVCVEKQSDSDYLCRVEMPPVREIAGETLYFAGKSYAVTRVTLPGIVHLVTEEKMEKAAAEAAVKLWCGQLKAEALGLMALDGERLTPLVYVPGADTLFWESACASGTAAVGAAACRKSGRTEILRLTQPGGVLTVEAHPDGKLLLTGTVKIMGEWSE